MDIKGFIGLLLIGITISAQAQLRLPLNFSDHAILQRDQSVVLLGWSKPVEEVSVTIKSKDYVARANAESIWQVQLPAESAGGPYHIKVTGVS